MGGSASEPAQRTDEMPAETIEAEAEKKEDENEAGFDKQDGNATKPASDAEIVEEPKMADLSDDAAVTKIANVTESLLKSTEGLEPLWTLHGYSLEADTAQTVGDKARAMGKNIGAIIKKIWDMIRALAAQVAEAVKNAWNVAKEYLGRAKEFAMRGLSARGDAVRAKLASFAEGIKAKLAKGDTTDAEIKKLMSAAEGGKASAFKALVSAAMNAPGQAVDKFDSWMLSRILKKAVFKDENGETFTLEQAPKAATESIYETAVSMEVGFTPAAALVGNAIGGAAGGTAGHAFKTGEKVGETIMKAAQGKVGAAAGAASQAAVHATMATLNWAITSLLHGAFSALMIGSAFELAILGALSAGLKIATNVKRGASPQVVQNLLVIPETFIAGMNSIIQTLGASAVNAAMDPSKSSADFLVNMFGKLASSVGKKLKPGTESMDTGDFFDLPMFNGEIMTVTMSGSGDELSFSTKVNEIGGMEVSYVDMTKSKSSDWKSLLKRLLGMFDPIQKLLGQASGAIKQLGASTAKAEQAAQRAGEEGEHQARAAAKVYNASIQMLQKVVVQPLKKLSETAGSAASTLSNAAFSRSVAGA